MIPVDQTTFGDEGNCFSACLASIFHLRADDVENFAVTKSSRWLWHVNAWLEPRGLRLVRINYSAADTCEMPGRSLCIASGPSPRGNRNHAVVWRGWELVHDPHPSRAGIVPHYLYVFVVAEPGPG